MSRRSSNLPHIVLALVAAFTSTAPATGQVSARQGAPEEAAVLVNDIVVAKAARGGMDTESGKMIVRRMEFSIPESAFEPDAEAVFRVTVSSRVA